MPGLQRSVAFGILIQALGSFTQPLLILVLARLGGPEIQGEFSKFKTWTDLLLAIGLAGFPQAFIYTINKKLADPRRLLEASALYAILSLMISCLFIAFGIHLGYIDTDRFRNLYLFVAFTSFGISSIIYCRLIRGIFLTVNEGLQFSVLTIIPGVAVFIFVTMAAEFNGFRYDTAYLLVGLATLIFSYSFRRRIEREYPQNVFGNIGLPIRTILTHSTGMLWQSVLYMLQPVLAIYVIELQGGGIHEVSYFNIACVVVVATNALIALIAPLAFNRWSKSPLVGVSSLAVARIYRICGVVLALSLLLALAVGLLVVPILGQEFEAAIPSIELMMTSLAAVSFTRMISPAIHAGGRPDVNTRCCLIRFVVFASTQFALAAWGMDLLMGATWAWVVSEWLAAAYAAIWVAQNSTRNDLGQNA